MHLLESCPPFPAILDWQTVESIPFIYNDFMPLDEAQIARKQCLKRCEIQVIHNRILHMPCFQHDIFGPKASNSLSVTTNLDNSGFDGFKEDLRSRKADILRVRRLSLPYFGGKGRLFPLQPSYMSRSSLCSPFRIIIIPLCQQCQILVSFGTTKATQNTFEICIYFRKYCLQDFSRTCGV